MSDKRKSELPKATAKNNGLAKALKQTEKVVKKAHEQYLKMIKISDSELHERITFEYPESTW